MYAARMTEGKWWVGFVYSDGTFDKVASYGSGEKAMRAAERMNKVLGNTPL